MKTYFMIAGRYCKIGRSKDPKKRRKDLQIGCPDIITIACIIDDDIEKDCHNVFYHQHKRGEWFNATHKVRTFIHKWNSGFRGTPHEFNFLYKNLWRKK